MKRKAAILIACHCRPEVLQLTLGSWLEAYDGSYDAEVVVSVHENYGDYHGGLGEIEGLSPPVRIVKVREDGWGGGILRYSRMHAKCLNRMMKCVPPDATHVAFLDHDLLFKADFVKWAMDKDADWVFSLFDDVGVNRPVTTFNGDKVCFAPKPSVWHMVVSKSLFDHIVGVKDYIMPLRCGEVVYDTFSQVLVNLSHSGWKLSAVPSAEMEKLVRHWWSMSFNFGPASNPRIYRERLTVVLDEYRRRFPGGIRHLLGKLET